MQLVCSDIETLKNNNNTKYQKNIKYLHVKESSRQKS